GGPAWQAASNTTNASTPVSFSTSSLQGLREGAPIQAILGGRGNYPAFAADAPQRYNARPTTRSSHEGRSSPRDQEPRISGWHGAGRRPCPDAGRTPGVRRGR